MKQHEAMLSLARGRGGSGAEQAGWGLGPTLPSTTGMPWAPIPSQDLCRLHAKCPSPPPSVVPSPKEKAGEEEGEATGRQREGRVEVLEETEWGPPWCGKLRVL